MSAKTYDRQTGKFLARVAENMPEMSGEIMQGWIENPSGLQEFLAGLCPEASKLLRRLTEVGVSAVKKFVVADNFKIGNAGIAWMGDNFKTNFLGKTEKNVKLAMLLVHRLEKASLDNEIREELGSNREETTLAHLFELLQRQSDGRLGILLTDGFANIFYIRDAKGDLWAVGAYWDARYGWCVGAGSVEDPDGWVGGHRVLSRK